jgi:GT2 family glycosyltransferase/nucleoside-diphosphate-sugar epimerase
MASMLITGASGFVGRAVCVEAVRRGMSVRGAVRAPVSLPAGVENCIVGGMDDGTDWTEALRDVDVVIHLAARVHVMRESVTDPLAEFLKVNLDGTVNLVRQAARAGVKRFVYVSSIKVNGEGTATGQAFSELDEPAPRDAYAVSKWRAEQALCEIERETGIEVVILRPPLVYGAGVKGNFLSLLHVVYKGIPLPLAGVHNVRSLLYLGNFVDALLLCAGHPAAAGKTYLLRDGEDVSISALIAQLAPGMGRKPRLFSLPMRLLRRLSALAGRQDSLERLVGSLRVDDAPIRKELGWVPPVSVPEGLWKTAAWYAKTGRPCAIPQLSDQREDCKGDCGVSVVIVNYNAGDILRDCVGHALEQAGQVIVVDNDSHDDSIANLRAAFPGVQVICNRHNLGFAKACNIGARAADGDRILFLNPDCLLEPGAIQALLDAFRNRPDVGMVGGLLTNPDGSEQGGARRAVPTPWRSFVRAFGLSAFSARYPRLFSDYSLHKEPLPEKPIEVEAISGACMMASREAMEEVGLMDEEYFMHCEDLDWCMRFQRSGWSLLFVPGARMVHHKGHCSKSRPIFVEWNKHRGMLRFYRKFFRHQYPGLLMWLVAVGVWLRFSLAAGYFMVRRLARRCGSGRG